MARRAIFMFNFALCVVCQCVTSRAAVEVRALTLARQDHWMCHWSFATALMQSSWLALVANARVVVSTHLSLWMATASRTSYTEMTQSILTRKESYSVTRSLRLATQIAGSKRCFCVVKRVQARAV